MTEDQLSRKYACLILWGDTWEESERLRAYVDGKEYAPSPNYTRIEKVFKDAFAERVNSYGALSAVEWEALEKILQDTSPAPEWLLKALREEKR